MNRVKVATWSEVPDRTPVGANVEGIDLVIVRRGDEHSVLYGRCLHRGARLADGSIVGDDLICGLHGWDYRIDTGVSAYNNAEVLQKFESELDGGDLFVDRDAVLMWKMKHPQPFDPDVYQGLYRDPHMVPEEPFVMYIHELAQFGLSKTGHHGPVAAMGVPRTELPTWDTMQIVTAQLARLPLLDDDPVGTDLCIGPNAAKPLWLDIPIFVSDMSFGALSQEAKTALARGAQLAGTGICSGEGGMLPEEQAENARYFYELASARFGWSFDILKKVQAFHFKGGQGAKTGTGGHLPGDKVVGRIAEVRGLPEGTPAISPPRFPDWTSLDDYRAFADRVREESGGIPIGFKLSAQHIEEDLDAALSVGVDYVILDGRGGGTGAAPLLFRNNISVPTIPALARARRHLDRRGRRDVTLVITGGLRDAADFAKALALGADAVAIANSAIQAIGCLGMRACHSNNCPVGIATQQPHLRARLPVDEAAQRLDRFLRASVELMQVLARACGHSHLNQFSLDDLTSFDRNVADLAGVAYGGVA
ncbi:MAG TPA: glutamate synthase-related protein [Acidimicrobiia bacterium]|jgi:nitrite reductase/ring-hydroxylating ferredoxin subunit|nr:glutamate synthase-related protein [Acidimicrobiia bacterium]